MLLNLLNGLKNSHKKTRLRVQTGKTIRYSALSRKQSLIHYNSMVLPL